VEEEERSPSVAKMNPSREGMYKNRWSEWSSTSSASNREEFAAQQRYHAGLNVAAMQNSHDSLPRYADHTYRDTPPTSRKEIG